MKYIAIIHKDEHSDYGVTIPDLPGCFSAGSSFEDAIDNAAEAIECHIEGCLEDKESVPLPKAIEKHVSSDAAKGGVFVVIDVDLSKLSGKARRVNITLPERILNHIDKYTSAHGSNRSGFIVDAAMFYLANHR